MTTTEEIIERDRVRKQKAVEAQRRYRLKLKEGTSKTTEIDYAQYKKTQASYMMNYRAQKKIAIAEAYAKQDTSPKAEVKLEKKVEAIKEKVNLAEVRRSNRESKQVDLSIQQVKPLQKLEVKKKIVPMWKRNLPTNPTEADFNRARAYPPDKRDVMLKKIYVVFNKVLNLEPSVDIKRVLKSVLSGYDVKGDLKYIRKNMPFLDDNKLIAFVNKVQDKYPKPTSFTTMIIPFVNVLARVDAYDSQYQQLTVIAKNKAKEYSEQRDENTTSKEDRGKIIKDFSPESVKKVIDTKLTTDDEKALAACYGLQPPRRLDFQYMIVTEEDPSVLNDVNFNYLVIRGGEPSRFIYNNFKTYKNFGKQDFAVNEYIAPYLSKHLKSSKLLPVKGRRYLFSSKQDKGQQSSNFGNKLKDTFMKMYGEEISVRWIRASASTYINNFKKPKPSLQERKAYSDMMAHSRAVSEQYEKILPEFFSDDEDEDEPIEEVVVEEVAVKEVAVEKKATPYKTRSRMK